MGSGDDDADAEQREKPLHQVDIPYGYWLARYPLTNEQYGLFVVARGYDEADYWPEAQQAGYWQNGRFTGLLDREGRTQPDDFGEPFTLPNHPVVGLSWYESLAFCRWLNQQWHHQGWLPAGYHLTLPSEAEWEKGARGGLALPPQSLVVAAGDNLTLNHLPPTVTNLNPQRLYPWGMEDDPDKANGKWTNLESTSPVGIFARGQTAYGLLDMSGNVYEWTRSRWGKSYTLEYKYPYKAADGREQLQTEDTRVLRGGSWWNEADALRCAYRFRFNPDHWNLNLGFRVVMSPSSFASSLASEASDL
jgi:formylglycine-generating enzyme required for sulfatase activity